MRRRSRGDIVTALLTHSRLSCFRACPRKHYLRYECGLRPLEDSFALRVGGGFHAALEAEFKGEDIGAAIEGRVTDPFDLALVATMFHCHQSRWVDDPVTVLEVEKPFELPLRNPETGAATPIWNLGGVVDRIVKLPDGRLAMMEYKTTTRDINPGSDYWVRIHLDPQLSIYLIALRALGYDISTILYDVTKRPMLRPLKATPEADRKFTKAGTLYANQRERDETPEEFAARVSEAMQSEPDKYFVRQEIARLDSDLDETAWELWQQQLAIREAQRSGRWYRNPNSCFTNSSSCEYLSICQSGCSIDEAPVGFKKIEDVHPEIARVARAEQTAQIEVE